MTTKMRTTSKMVIDEEPLMFQPSLAKAVGVPAAAFIQQLHFRLRISTNFYDGRHWVYKTIPEWVEELRGVWVDKTIKRAITELKNAGVLLVGNYNKVGFDQTNWYTIDYDVLDSLGQCPDDGDKKSLPKGKNVPLEQDNKSQTSGQNVPVREGQIVPTNTKEVKNTTKEDQEYPTTPTTTRAREDWTKCLEILEVKLSYSSYLTWIKPLVPIDYVDDVLVLAVPDEHHRDWVKDRYAETLKSAYTEATKTREPRFKIVVRPEMFK